MTSFYTALASPPAKAWWAYLERVVAELADIFPDEFFHGGADEFRPDCWFDSAALKAWSLAHSMATPTELLDYFYKRWQTILLKAGRRPMFWDEFFWVYDAVTPTRTRLTVLPGTTATVRGVSGSSAAVYASDQQEWADTLRAGIPAVSTGTSEMWYLDRVGKLCGGVDPSLKAPDSYFWQAWQTYHDHDPFAHLDASILANRSLMLGGEVDMWGEGVDDNNFESFVFPKASAAAERMWSFEASAAPGTFSWPWQCAALSCRSTHVPYTHCGTAVRASPPRPARTHARTHAHTHARPRAGPRWVGPSQHQARSALISPLHASPLTMPA